MRIRVTLTIDVDPEEWAVIYGTGTAVAKVRPDVIAHVRDVVLRDLQDEGLAAQVYVAGRAPVKYLGFGTRRT